MAQVRVMRIGKATEIVVPNQGTVIKQRVRIKAVSKQLTPVEIEFTESLMLLGRKVVLLTNEFETRAKEKEVLLDDGTIDFYKGRLRTIITENKNK